MLILHGALEAHEGGVSMKNKVQKILSIAVASDLHAYLPSDLDPNERPPSKLSLADPEDNPTSHPFSALYDLIKKDQLTADLFLCPGDMTDKANPQGIKYAWEKIHTAGKLLGAPLTAATVGNHDLDSRGKTRAETPKELLDQLDPPFPLPGEALINEFWANHFTVYQGENYTLVLLDTCAKHTDKAELERGYITKHTITKLTKKLDSAQSRQINILLCHHHPHQHSELSLGDRDVMKNGQLLIDLLALNGNWLIIHGHKHFPKLSYAAGGASSPVVFAAGSFSGNFGCEAESRTRNQFHLIDVVHYEDKPFALYGAVRSWYWAAGSGWLKSTGGATGMPAVTGFGARLHPSELAKLVAARMTRSKLKRWEELCQTIPELRFQLPQDYLLFKQVLAKDHRLHLVEENGTPLQVGGA